MPASRSSRNKGHAKRAEANKKVKKRRGAKKAASNGESDGEKILRWAREIWDETLVPWVVDHEFCHPTGTKTMEMADAMIAYSLTEEEILTLSYESVPNSDDIFFAYEDIVDLYDRKDDAAAYPLDMEIKNQDRLGVFEKVEYSDTPCRRNFMICPPYLPPRELFRFNH